MILPDQTLKWFKLARDPFSGELHSKRDVYMTRAAAIAEVRIWKAIDEHLLAALVGDVGSGKSTLIEKILEEMSRNQMYHVVRIYSLERKRLRGTHICDAITFDLIGSRSYTGIEDKSREVKDILNDVHDRGKKVLLCIDEAHEVPSQTLRDLKKLHEVGGKFRCPLAIVLVGQQRLHRRLQREVALKEVLDRCEVIEMPGLKNEATGNTTDAVDYLAWKLKRAGDRAISDIFAPDGLDMLMSHPAVRAPLGINNLVSLAMNVAVTSKRRMIDADVMAHAFTQIDVDGLVTDPDKKPKVAEVAA